MLLPCKRDPSPSRGTGAVGNFWTGKGRNFSSLPCVLGQESGVLLSAAEELSPYLTLR